MLKPLGAGYEVINVENGKMVCIIVKELDEDQAVVLAESRAEDGRIVEETLVIRRGWTREWARTALENMLLRDGLCWLDTQDELHRKAYWVPSAMRWDDPSKVVVVTPSTSLRCKWYGGVTVPCSVSGRCFRLVHIDYYLSILKLTLVSRSYFLSLIFSYYDHTTVVIRTLLVAYIRTTLSLCTPSLFLNTSYLQSGDCFSLRRFLCDRV